MEVRTLSGRQHNWYQCSMAFCGVCLLKNSFIEFLYLIWYSFHFMPLASAIKKQTVHFTFVWILSLCELQRDKKKNKGGSYLILLSLICCACCRCPSVLVSWSGRHKCQYWFSLPLFMLPCFVLLCRGKANLPKLWVCILQMWNEKQTGCYSEFFSASNH